ncbi:hypothetical protein OSH11_17315 [Kaistia dalseonensis]|uniref:Meckel syndrome type 1 protein n=1 Tax=Kaistia dalseonensis TaxID=410840 RepID=A0ABU0HC44_9HYPH|nr:hypothetical protein [Kaistia dalseonensis]MCX5496469.1 hypothetical protein [Kaistia dalseonensis]MDQ0439091.1 Meckel syndrome type 1 protein [Kaistia dalseonensis]
MKLKTKMFLLGASLSLGLAATILPAGAATKSPAMTACSDQWSTMKADGKVPAGTTWPQFWSQCSKDYAAAHPAEAAETTKAAATAPEEPAPAPAKKTAKAAAPAAAPAEEPAAASTGKSAAMTACSDEWGSMKAAGKTTGQTWPKFWSECAKTYAAAHPEDAASSAKAAATKAPKAVKPVEADEGLPLPDPEKAASIDTTAKPKRPLTPGQQAAIVRIKACGAEWQANKKAGKLPAGAKWPQYWSDCNKRLKAQGQ